MMGAEIETPDFSSQQTANNTADGFSHTIAAFNRGSERMWRELAGCKSVRYVQDKKTGQQGIIHKELNVRAEDAHPWNFKCATTQSTFNRRYDPRT